MAEEFDPKKLRALTPEERLKRLRKLEDERKKELKETESLISESISQIEEEARKAEGPPAAASPRPIEEESDLERQVAQTEPTRAPEPKQRNVEYVINLYGELGRAEDDRERAADIYRRILQNERYMGQDETVKQIAEGSRRMMKELFGEYRANLEYR
jgi:hypothetical protein